MEGFKSIMEYKIVIPSYLRHKELEEKTLKTLQRNNINPKRIYIFVADNEERLKYINYLDCKLYGQIIIGVKGIRNQRIFISKYFNQGEYIVSCDDDIEDFYRLKMVDNKKTLETIKNIEYEIMRNFILCKNYDKYLWGVNGHHNPYWMNEDAVCGLYFCVGVFHGYINRHMEDLYPNELSETKEDYEQVILFCKKDKGVIRRNDLAFKTKYNAPGGLGQDRFERNKIAQEYLTNKYPEYCYEKFRKDGTPEIRLKVFKKKKS